MNGVGLVLLGGFAMCTSDPQPQDDDTADWNSRTHFTLLQSEFRFSNKRQYFSSEAAVPYAYHLPRVHTRIEKRADDRLKTLLTRDMRIEIGLARRRKLTKEEGGGARRVLWARTPLMSLTALMPSMASPRLVGRYFHVLTSMTRVHDPDIPGVRSIWSRFFCAPVLVGRCSWDASLEEIPELENPGIEVFSICMEHSNAPSDLGIPLLHRPQRIVDGGIVSPNVWDAALRMKMDDNTSQKCRDALGTFGLTRWTQMVSDTCVFSRRKWSTAEIYSEGCRDPEDEGRESWPGSDVFQRYDEENGTYIFYNERSTMHGVKTGIAKAEVLMFLDPSLHFKSEEKLWELYVGLWRNEMIARYGRAETSRLMRQKDYFHYDTQLAEECDRFVGRYNLIEKTATTRRAEKRKKEKMEGGCHDADVIVV